MRYIPPDDLIFEWERVREGLSVVKKNSSEDWLPEDVYMSLKINQSSLYIEEDKDGEYLGFFIAQILPMYHGKRLHIWIAHSANKQPMLRTFLRSIRELAAQTGMKKITYTSPRDEWDSVSPRGGFNKQQTTYALDL